MDRTQTDRPDGQARWRRRPAAGARGRQGASLGGVLGGFPGPLPFADAAAPDAFAGPAEAQPVLAFRAPARAPSLWRSAVTMADLVYHSTVRDIRKGHRNALAGLLLNIVQTVLMLATFWAMFWIFGARGSAIRGDYLLYLMSGIFLYMVHTKAMGAIVRAEGPTSPMMHHAPLNTTVTMAAAALSSLYLQILSLSAILFVYHVAWNPVVIDEPLGAIGMVLVAWISGVGVGLCFAALKPWFPDAATLLSSVYGRVNMIASGKMFVANTLPGSILVFFDWNPLFHAIDQARGFIFLNYHPHFSSWRYPLWVALGLIVLGLLAESYTRRHASLSWRMGR